MNKVINRSSAIVFICCLAMGFFGYVDKPVDTPYLITQMHLNNNFIYISMLVGKLVLIVTLTCSIILLINNQRLDI